MTIVFLVTKLRWWVWNEFVLDAFGMFRLFSNFISDLSFVEMSCDIMWHDIIWHNIWYDIYKIMLDAFGMFSLVFQFYVCLIVWWNVLFCDMVRYYLFQCV
jgi:hypothetical protein